MNRTSGRVLLVENDAAIQELVLAILESEGYLAVGVDTPADALTILECETFDLIVTDGFARASDPVLAGSAPLVRRAGTTPIALFTAHRVERDAALAAGFSELIEKPFDLDTFERRVRALLPA